MQITWQPVLKSPMSPIFKPRFGTVNTEMLGVATPNRNHVDLSDTQVLEQILPPKIQFPNGQPGQWLQVRLEHKYKDDVYVIYLGPLNNRGVIHPDYPQILHQLRLQKVKPGELEDLSGEGTLTLMSKAHFDQAIASYKRTVKPQGFWRAVASYFYPHLNQSGYPIDYLFQLETARQKASWAAHPNLRWPLMA